MQKEDLIGKFHAHITIPETMHDMAVKILNKNKVRYKITIIDLSHRSAIAAIEQRDVMITMHMHTFKFDNYRNIEKEVLRVNRILNEAGIITYRVKIEHEDLPTLAPTVYTYRECHIKVGFKKDRYFSVFETLQLDENLSDIRFSNNPNSLDDEFVYYFMNIRTRSGTVDDFDRKVKSIESYVHTQYPDLLVSSPKIETTVVDTRQSRDNWWA